MSPVAQGLFSEFVSFYLPTRIIWPFLAKMSDQTNAERLMSSALDAKDAEIADLRNQIRLFRELLAAVKVIYAPLPGDRGNPCVSPSPEQGRRIAAAIQ